MRASTKTKTEVSIKVRQHEAKVAAQTKRVVAPEEKVKTDFTQEELLLEATETEHINANWVAKQRQLAEENKVRAYIAKTVELVYTPLSYILSFVALIQLCIKRL
jgi:hypothetical protein